MENKTQEISFSELKKNIEKTGCSYRWNYPVIKYDRAEIRTCCQVGNNERIDAKKIASHGTGVFLNSDWLRARKHEMLNGIKHTDCSACWKLESDGIQSMRQRAPDLTNYLGLSILSRLGTQKLSASDIETLSAIARPHMLEIHLDNVCDLACLYCNPSYSTTWARKLGKIEGPLEKDFLSQFQSTFWCWYREVFAELDGICLIGGEPLVSPNFFKVINEIHTIHKTGSRKIKKQQFISITSNFNARPDIFEKFLTNLELLSPYFNLSINASCESVGEKAEFIREGLVWKRFESNVHRILEFIKKTKENRIYRLDFSLHAAQNLLSLTSLKEFLSWAEMLEREHKVAVNLIQNIVSFPQHLSAQSLLPSHYAAEILSAAEFAKNHKSEYDYISSSTWAGYSDFLVSIASGIKDRIPAEQSLRSFSDWYEKLSEEKKGAFMKLFSLLAKDLL